MKNLGLKQAQAEKCIYHLKKDSCILLVTIYVDDFIIATNNLQIFNDFKHNLSLAFQIRDLGPLQYCLGIEFMQNPENMTVEMKQEKFIKDLTLKFNMHEAKFARTPLEPKAKFELKDESPEVDNEIYRKLIGSLLYISTGSRPDISYAVSILSSFNQQPRLIHWISAKRILRYLSGTCHYSLFYQKQNEPLLAYVDADWAGDINDRISRSGYVFKLSGAAIAWESRKQKRVALSTTEAEYIALSEAAKETAYIKALLLDLKLWKKQTVTLYCDNQGAGKLAKNPVYHSKTKHIDIRYHYIRQMCEEKEIEVQYVPTQEMTADILTKSLASPMHNKCIQNLGFKMASENVNNDSPV